VLTNHILTRSVLLLAPSHVVPTERGLFTIASLDHTAPTVDYVNALVQVIRPGIGVNSPVGTSFSQVNHLPIKPCSKRDNGCWTPLVPCARC
jgi:hypothetical protein